MSLRVKQLKTGGEVFADVPASKSILSRALLLSAFCEGDTLLLCGPRCADNRALFAALGALGFSIEECEAGLLVHGKAEVPNPHAAINVGSAGTAARFLTAVLAFRGGDYEFSASEQMSRRPMDLLKTLGEAGVRFEFHGEPYKFPFRMTSDGIGRRSFSADTSASSQFASGLMLGEALACGGEVVLTGTPRDSFPAMTLRLIEEFGGSFKREENRIEVSPVRKNTPRYAVEADISGACYFFALALLLQKKVTVRGLSLAALTSPLQGDARFLRELTARGATLSEGSCGLILDGSHTGSYEGFVLDVGEFADQALTLAALAPFARSETRLRGISHLRVQECDRVYAIVKNLQTLGAEARAEKDEIVIEPSPIRGGTVETFGDHRVAMAFSLIGMRTGNVCIDDPSCTEKTFEGFFEIVSRLE